MSTAEEISLLGHLNTPILVGDPDGCIVYANPCFRRVFGAGDDDLMGRPLALVFGGGAREAVLSATATVLERGQAARLQIREGGSGWAGLASPIEAEDDRVGVVMVLLEEQSNEEPLTALTEEIGEPLSEALGRFQSLAPHVAARLKEDQRQAWETGLRALENAKQSLRDLQLVLRGGGKPRQGRFDVASVILRVAERTGHEVGSAGTLEVLMPPNLPRVVGTATTFERLMGQLLRERLNEAREESPMTLLARTVGEGEPSAVLVSLVDVPDADRRAATGLPPDSVSQGVAAIGGDAICVEDSVLGRVTSLRLAIADS